MASSYKITLIGAGNVSSHLALAFENSGHEVLEIYSRKIEKAQAIAGKLNKTKAVDTTDFSDSRAEVFFISVSDDAIVEIVDTFTFPSHAVVVHTSGTVSLDVLKPLSQPTGVFYPVQTFTKGKKVDFESVPIVIESKTVDAEIRLSEIAVSISSKLFYLNSERRKVLHLAAVFASNFINHLLGISKEILRAEQIDDTILNALIIETVDKALSSDPFEVQTGPASRKDIKTVQSHIEMLGSTALNKEIYKILTESIMKRTSI